RRRARAGAQTAREPPCRAGQPRDLRLPQRQRARRAARRRPPLCAGSGDPPVLPERSRDTAPSDPKRSAASSARPRGAPDLAQEPIPLRLGALPEAESARERTLVSPVPRPAPAPLAGGLERRRAAR